MVEITEMYERTVDLAGSIDSAILVSASEGSSGLQIGGNRDVPQIIEVEFNSSVPKTKKEDFFRLTQGTEWEFVDEDNVFNGDNERNGLVSISRDVKPEDVPPFRNFDEDTYFND